VGQRLDAWQDHGAWGVFSGRVEREGEGGPQREGLDEWQGGFDQGEEDCLIKEGGGRR